MKMHDPILRHVFYLDEFYPYYKAQKPYPPELEIDFYSHQDVGGIHGVFWFDPASNEENRFVNYCAHKGITHKRFDIWTASQNQIQDEAFYLLWVKDAGTSIRNPFPYEELFEYSLPCISQEKVGGGNGCGFVKKQALKITLDTQQMPRHLDLMTGGWGLGLYIVSRRLFNFLKGANFTGFQLVPCLNTKREYPMEYNAFDIKDSVSDENADYYQLFISAQTLSPIYLGVEFAREKACERCNVLTNLNDNIYTEYFPPHGLGTEDIQTQSLYQLPDGRILRHSSPSTYVSGRLMKALLKEKFKGIEKFMKSPLKIDYWQVNIRGEE